MGLIDSVLHPDWSGRNRWRARWVPAALSAILLTGRSVSAQDEVFDFSLDRLRQQVDELVKEHLPDSDLALPEPDPAQMEEFFRQLQAQLEGEYVLDLVPFKRTVDFLLPLLEAHEPLRDLGAWLRSRRDYFAVLDELNIVVPPPPATNAPATVIPPPPEALTRPTAPRPPVIVPSAPQPPPGKAAAATQLTNQVTAEIARDDEEPVAVNVVIVPPPTAIPPAPRPPTTPGAAPPAPQRPAPPTLRRDNPPQEAVRAAWSRQLAGRDLPAGAVTWVPRLKPIFLAAGIPAELVWLAEVESGFDPRARSPSGAVGLYQLMPITGRSLGLSTFPFDQRKDPEKSSRAAARYLRQLYDQFGDWPLVLAAYNAGPSRVRMLLTAHRATSFGEIARHLPAETQLYVPKFEAVLQRREGRRWADLTTPESLPGPLGNDPAKRPPK